MREQRREVLGSSIRGGELQELMSAERGGLPFLFLRDGEERLRVIVLEGDRLVLGRAPGSDVEIAWDPQVSGIHAWLERRGAGWVVQDDGLSRNGTFIDGERLHGQRALRDGDVLLAGATKLGYRDPDPRAIVATIDSGGLETPPVSEAQRRVLIELCRPLASEGRSVPATNQEIADRLALSLKTVKAHLGVLFERFRIADLPQNEKRARLAEAALDGGAVRAADVLRDPRGS